MALIVPFIVLLIRFFLRIELIANERNMKRVLKFYQNFNNRYKIYLNNLSDNSAKVINRTSLSTVDAGCLGTVNYKPESIRQSTRLDPYCDLVLNMALCCLSLKRNYRHFVKKPAVVLPCLHNACRICTETRCEYGELQCEHPNCTRTYNNIKLLNEMKLNEIIIDLVPFAFDLNVYKAKYEFQNNASKLKGKF